MNNIDKMLKLTGYKGKIEKVKTTTIFNTPEFKKRVREEAGKFRSMKIKELFDKSKEERTEIEEDIIVQWIEQYGDDL